MPPKRRSQGMAEPGAKRARAGGDDDGAAAPGEAKRDEALCGAPAGADEGLEAYPLPGHPYGLAWEERDEGTVLVLAGGAPPERGDGGGELPRVASFDLDSTLVVPKSGKKFADARDDWRWWSPAVLPRLRRLHRDGYHLVVFTNQAGIEKGRASADNVRGKLLDISEAVGAPVRAYVAAASNHARKPGTHLWEELAADLGVADADALAARSFYVGDAAGRAKNWARGKKRDFSCSDRKFAANAGLPFYTPEEFFEGDTARPPVDWRTPSPASLLAEARAAVAGGGLRAAAGADGFRPGAGGGALLGERGPELVVLCGPPGGGKSTLAERVFVAAGYERVNQDTLKRKERCVAVAREALAQGRSVVVDNTNRDDKTRRLYTAVAREQGVPARAVYLDLAKPLCMHLNLYRERASGGASRRVPSMVIHAWYKNHTRPARAEGFAEVGTLSFVPQFADAESRRLFLQWS